MQQHDDTSVRLAGGCDIHESHAEMLIADLKGHEVDGIGIGPAFEPDPKWLGIGWAGNAP
jgi:hypothetical protein